jgi:hypothetical protein
LPAFIDQAASFVPSFIYNYQCSSSLLTTFVNVFVIRYVFSGVLKPIVSRVVIAFVLSNTRTGFLYDKVQSLFLPKLWKFAIFPEDAFQSDPNEDNQNCSDYESSVTETRKILQLEKRLFLMQLFGDVSVLVTYGLCFPPLALIVVISILAGLQDFESVIVYLQGRIAKHQMSSSEPIEPVPLLLMLICVSACLFMHMLVCPYAQIYARRPVTVCMSVLII